MLFLAAFINYIDRAALSIAAPYIPKEFNLILWALWQFIGVGKLRLLF
jgi:hypothetical protein